MDSLLIINASPRAPRSNSRIFATLLERYCAKRFTVENAVLGTANHGDLIRRMKNAHHLVLIFPLYLDTIPAALLDFLKTVEHRCLNHRLVVHVIVNCAMLESERNSLAIRTIRFFCRKNGFHVGSTLCIGSGDTIMETPFRYLVRYRINAFARTIIRARTQDLRITAPLSKSLFVRISAHHWLELGKKHGNTRESMARMDILPLPPPSL